MGSIQEDTTGPYLQPPTTTFSLNWGSHPQSNIGHVVGFSYLLVDNTATYKSSITCHSKSLQMTPFDRSHTTLYPRSIVTLALACTIYERARDIAAN